MLMLILWLAIIGFIVGLIARAIVPGPDPMGIFGTILLGLAGSVVGGFIAGLLFRPDNGSENFGPAGFIGSILGAVLLLVLWRFATGRGRTGYGFGRRRRVW